MLDPATRDRGIAKSVINPQQCRKEGEKKINKKGTEDEEDEREEEEKEGEPELSLPREGGPSDEGDPAAETTKRTET